MYCRNCGHKVADDDLFCENCGTRIDRNKTLKAENPASAAGYTPSGQGNITQAAGYTAPVFERKQEERTDSTDTDYDYTKLPTEKPSGIKSLYFMDFLIRLGHKENIPLCIYLVLNVLLIGVFVTAVCALPVGWGMLAALLLYIASISIAVSPIGEYILRRQNGCRKIQDAAIIERLEPIFREVYYKAKKRNPEISSDVRLFINDDDCPNAFATGRRTVCVTRGLLTWSDAEIKAALGHEFGHLAHKDTDRILVVAIGNTVIAGICYMFQIAAIVMDVIIAISSLFMKSENGFWVRMISAFSRFITVIVIRAFNRIWTQIGVLLCMKTSRGNEYQADEFSCRLGYGDALCQLLSTLPSAKPKGLFANLASSHPASEDRVARIRALAQSEPAAEE